MFLANCSSAALLCFLFLNGPLSADTVSQTATPTQRTINNSNTLVLHKPATDPSWGKVIQFEQEQAISVGDRSKETIYKFLFQDSQGVIRLATYHETSDSGYWEVWIWDQP